MKRTKIIALFFILMVLINSIAYSQQQKGNVYVVPIKGEINNATYQFLKGTIDKISTKDPSAIIFEIDTYGGQIDQAEKIKNLIYNIDIPTISFVNNKAESAGVLITISSEKVVMAESSTIGSAETIPNTEKVMSMWVSFLRDMAELRNRDSKIVTAMADKDVEIEGIKEKGKLLNINAREAKKFGIADYVSNSYEDMLEYFNINYSDVVKVEEGKEIKVAKFVTNPYISTLLLTIGFVGVIIEVFTPGFGIGGIISLVAFGLFFGGNILAGNSQWTSLVLFVIGLILLVIEGMIPGFGLPGISGIVLIIVGIILAMDSFSGAIISLSIAIIVTTVISIVLIKYGYRSPLISKAVLSKNQRNEDGYVSANPKVEFLNKEGIAITELRPTGVVDVDNHRIDALSEGNYIDKGSKVKVVRVEGSKIIVRRM